MVQEKGPLPDNIDEIASRIAASARPNPYVEQDHRKGELDTSEYLAESQANLAAVDAAHIERQQAEDQPADVNPFLAIKANMDKHRGDYVAPPKPMLDRAIEWRRAAVQKQIEENRKQS